jgi:hypothetical protein
MGIQKEEKAMTIVEALEQLHVTLQANGGDRVQEMVVSHRTMDLLKCNIEGAWIILDTKMETAVVEINGTRFYPPR